MQPARRVAAVGALVALCAWENAEGGCPSVVWSAKHTTVVSVRHAVPIDYDRDGKLDLAAITLALAIDPWVTRLQLFRGVGNGSFEAPVPVYAMDDMIDLEVADITGDGIDDLVLAIKTGRLAVLAGNGTTGFGAPAFINTFSSPSIMTGDFDNDGLSDDIAAFTTPSEYAFYRGPDFVQRGRAGLGKAVRSAVFADFDDDGYADIAAVGSDGLNVFYRNSDGTYGTPVIYGGGQLGALETGDMNGDGAPDLVSTRPVGEAVLFTNAGARAFTQSSVVLATESRHLYAGAIFVHDVDSDGRDDIMVTMTDWTGYFVTSTSSGNGTLRTATATHLDFGDFVAAFAAGDFDGDGARELVRRDADSGRPHPRAQRGLQMKKSFTPPLTALPSP